LRGLGGSPGTAVSVSSPRPSLRLDTSVCLVLLQCPRCLYHATLKIPKRSSNLILPGLLRAVSGDPSFACSLYWAGRTRPRRPRTCRPGRLHLRPSHCPWFARSYCRKVARGGARWCCDSEPCSTRGCGWLTAGCEVASVNQRRSWQSQRLCPFLQLHT
jgi:hypothetical protein